MAESEALKVQKDVKPWSREQIFQRVGSPSFKEGAQPLDGNGHPRGTRRLTDMPLTFGGLSGVGDALVNRIFEQGARMVPNWVRTLGPLKHGAGPEQAGEHEVYGRLLRSFQTWTDVPGFQWHRWYDWNLHIQPAEAFDWLRGAANRIPLKKEAEPGAPPLDQFVDGSLECEWDMGSIGPAPGPMFTDVDKGTQSRWMWPMTGDLTWVVGRSIYDGGHEFSAETPDPADPTKTIKGPPLARSELHPVKAMAHARVEAIPFAGSKHRVPVTQFAFFASVSGGYIDFASLSPVGDDYEFLVDLPRRPDDFQPLQHNIGATPDFPFNRLALRRLEPTFELDFVPYQNAFGALPVSQLRDKFAPSVTFETPDPERPDEVQARIRIPLKQLAAQSAAKSYGVVVNVGWPDPNQTQGKKVKRCLVTLQRIHPVTGLEGNGEWRAKLAVNRRWFHVEQHGIRDEQVGGGLFGGPKRRDPSAATDMVRMPPAVEFFLPEDEHVEVHAHVWELNLMDDIYLRPADGRTVKFNRVQVFAEALRSGDDPGTALAGDPLTDVAAFVASIPLAVLELIETIPVVGFVVQLIETLLSLLPGSPSPTNLLGLLGERPADWREHVDVQPPRPEGQGSFVVQRVVARNAILLMADSLNQENKPLAVLDAGAGFPEENAKNPLPVKDDGTTPVKLTAVALEEDSLLAELFEFKRTGSAAAFSRDLVRYELEYTVEISAQELG
jgi:hypothetical protein